MTNLKMKKQILIINHEVEESENIKNALTSEASEVVCTKSMHEALIALSKFSFCLVILDAHMSATDDHSFLRTIRKTNSSPILVLSSKTDHSHRIHALKAGAHAYMGQPYTLEECMAQAHSLMQLYSERYAQDEQCYTLVFGNDLIIDPSARKVFLNAQELKFTKTEFDLLFCLASNPGRVFSRTQLYESIWNEQSAYNVDEVVKYHIKTLRKKLMLSAEEYIKNVWGVGYVFDHKK